MPLNPSGVTATARRHRAVGFERELAEVSELLYAAKRGTGNVLAVVVAPYGWGKSEFLDEVEALADAEGFDVVRTALTLSAEYRLERLVAERKGERPLLVLVDEADEVSRLAAAHRLGAINDERFREMVQMVALSIRALLEPKSYSHLVGDPTRLKNIAILVALTPQLYYSILKNIVPDIFDLSSGRVYKEIVLDTRFPFWQFVEIIRSRLQAYSTDARIKLIEGGMDPLHPFTLADLAALYHVALRRGEVGPRPLLKLAARLFIYKQEGKRTADLLRELGVEAPLDDDVLELAVAAIPHTKQEYVHISKRVYIYRIPYSDKEALSIAREYLALSGINLDIKDPKNVSLEPYIYYLIKEGRDFILYIFFEEKVKELEHYFVAESYVISEDVARKIWGVEGAKSAAALAKEYGERLESPSFLQEEIIKALGVEGIKARVCCGQLIWSNSLGIREGYLTFHVDSEGELEKVANMVSDIIGAGMIKEYIIDAAYIIISSKVLLSETIRSRLVPLLGAYWKRHYQEPASNYVTLVIYGADGMDRLKHELVMSTVSRLLKREPTEPEFVKEIRLGRERARENVLRYTLALKRGKEKKQATLLKAAEQMARGEMPEGLASYLSVERILLSTFDNEIHEKELISQVSRLFPVNLWRDLKEEDLVELMKLRGVIIPKGDKLVKYSEEEAKKHLAELVRALESMAQVVVERQTPHGPLRLSRLIALRVPSLDFAGRAEYSAKLLEVHRLLMEAKEEGERIKKELEKDVEHRVRFLKRIENIFKRIPARSRVVNPLAVTEQELQREEELAQKYEEAMRIWKEVKPIAEELGEQVDVDSDMEILLSTPAPQIDDYLSELKLYATELRRRHIEALRRRETMDMLRLWLEAKRLMCDGDVERCLKEAAARLSVDPAILRAVALRGVGSEVSPREVADELKLDTAIVENQLEALYRAGLIVKKYVA